MVFGQITPHLFRIAQEVVRLEWETGYPEIAKVKGTFAWWFLEHISELLPDQQFQLSQALVKRRFSLQGLRSDEVQLSSGEAHAIERLLAHDNSLHGTRATTVKAASVLEEDYLTGKYRATLASKENLCAAVVAEMNRSPLSVTVLKKNASELRWFAPLADGFRLNGLLDLGGQSEQASNFVMMSKGDQPLHAHTSLLAILGIGPTSWSYLFAGEESLFSSVVVGFFCKLSNHLSSVDLAKSR